MAKRIYKYNFPGNVIAPVSRWLQARMQNERPVIWAELDDDCPVQEWVLIYVGTGWEIENDEPMYDIMQHGQYCGTVEDGPYMWHVYACPKQLIKEKDREKELELS